MHGTRYRYYLARTDLDFDLSPTGEYIYVSVDRGSLYNYYKSADPAKILFWASYANLSSNIGLQFYPSVVYIMAGIYIQTLVIVVIMGKLIRKIYFSQVRAAEFEL